MMLRPALFLASLLLCTHLNEGKFTIKLSSLLGSKRSSFSLADRLRNWIEANRAAGATEDADDVKDDGVNDDSDDAKIEDDVDDDDEDEPEARKKKWLIYWKLKHGSGCKSNLMSSIVNKFREYANKYRKPAVETPIDAPMEKPVKIGGGGKDQMEPEVPPEADAPMADPVQTTAVPTLPVSVP